MYRISLKFQLANKLPQTFENIVQVYWNTAFFRFLPKKLETLLVSLSRKIIEDRTISGDKRNDVFQVMMAFRENDDQGGKWCVIQIYISHLDVEWLKFRFT